MDTSTDTPNGSATRTRLERPKDDRVIAGVAAGIAKYTNTSTAFVRLATIALTIFGGAGLLLYGAGWALIPKEGDEDSLAEHFLDGLDTNEKRIGAALMGLAAVIVITGGISPGLVAVAALASIGFLLTRSSNQKEN